MPWGSRRLPEVWVKGADEASASAHDLDPALILCFFLFLSLSLSPNLHLFPWRYSCKWVNAHMLFGVVA